MSEYASAILDRPPSPDAYAAVGIFEVEASLDVQAAPEATLGYGIAAAANMRFAVGDTSCSALVVTTELRGGPQEKYNRSLRAYRELGRIANLGCLESEAGQAAFENVRRDLMTSLAEMFENGEEFRGGFEISDTYDYPIIDDQVHFKTADGYKPIRQVTEDGAVASWAAAQADPLMLPQAHRDRADVYNAARVDDMVAGRLGSANTRLVVSRDLGAIIKPGSPHRELYLGKGYRDGLSFAQLYFKNGARLLAGTFSIDGVSDEVFNTALAELGTLVPKGESRHDSVKHGVELNLPDKEAAVAFVHRFRQRCYELQGDRRERRSVSQFMRERGSEVDSYIKALCVPLAISVDSKRKHRRLHDFVGNLLDKPDHLKSEVVGHLSRVQRADVFTDDDGRLLSGVIMYAIAEALYEGAKSYVKGGWAVPHGDHRPRQYVLAAQQMPLDLIARQLAGAVHVGVEKGRTHSGGCPGEVALGNNNDKSKDPLNPQAAFGGLEGENKESAAMDKYGKMSFTCPNPKCRRENYRDYNQLKAECKHCRKEIPKC